MAKNPKDLILPPCNSVIYLMTPPIFHQPLPILPPRGISALSRMAIFAAAVLSCLSISVSVHAQDDSPQNKQKTAKRPSGQAVEVRPASGVRVEQNIVYLSPDRKEKMDIYLPADAKPGDTFPCIVDIHGGGFTGGDKSDRR